MAHWMRRGNTYRHSRVDGLGGRVEVLVEQVGGRWRVEASYALEFEEWGGAASHASFQRADRWAARRIERWRQEAKARVTVQYGFSL